MAIPAIHVKYRTVPQIGLIIRIPGEQSLPQEEDQLKVPMYQAIRAVRHKRLLSNPLGIGSWSK